jgi:hypothetical protein
VAPQQSQAAEVRAVHTETQRDGVVHEVASALKLGNSPANLFAKLTTALRWHTGISFDIRIF